MPTPHYTKSIALIGMMGAGKSSLGRKLARQLGLKFQDSDTEIEKRSGLTITEVFSSYGEDYFRKAEYSVIKRLLDDSQIILATGGGAFTYPQTQQMLKERTISIWLKVEFETLWDRLKDNDQRPLLQTSDPKTTLRRLCDEREPVYAQADITLDCSKSKTHESLQMLQNAIDDWVK